MPDPIDRLNAALADRYRLERELGAGGMATVYLAEDLKHRRHVALKVLKPELAAVLGAERFVQEITTTASLQHPHILPLFDSGRADGFLYYVMPYVEGETLRSRLDRETQLGVEDAVRIATEVADALDYAHRHGVIHRDIKPENILLHDGRPMVADFGIALAVSAAAGGRMTETGLSLGTPHYMSPEQATADKEISGRSDIYSLASVLYEMLAGQPPHLGGSAQQIIMKIIAEAPPDLRALRKSVPPNVAAAVEKALEKLPADRFGSAAEFAAALANRGFAIATTGAPGPAGRVGIWNRLTVAMASLAAVMTVVAVGAIVTRPVIRAPRVLRTTIELPDQVQLGGPTIGSRVAISRDGSRIVFVGFGGPQGGRRLWTRIRDRLEAVPVPGTEGANAPFLSPDGTRVGFYTVDPSSLRWVPLDGGPVVTVADTGFESGFGRTTGGAIWGPDGAIYSGSAEGTRRIPENGGPWTLVSRTDTAKAEKGHVPTDLLPNGRGLIVTVAHTPNSMPSLFEIAALDLSTGKHRVLTRGVYGRYLEPGYLVFVRADGVLMAAPFDLDRLDLTGPPVALSGGTAAGGPLRERFRDFALTPDGTLLHPDQGGEEDLSELVWVRRDGTLIAVDPSWRAAFESVALSPDGARLAVGLLTRDGAEVWIAQLPGGPRARLTTEGSINYRPSWLPDGNRVAYRSMSPTTGRFELLAKRADGLGSTERLAFEARSVATGQVSPDGVWTIFRTDALEGGRGDILAIRAGDTVPTPLVATPAEERYPALSPNGQWLAYRSDEGGANDVWVRPFPKVGEGKWQVSVSGGTEPRWSRNGKELFYLTAANELVSATVTTSPPFVVLERRVLFTRPATMAQNVATATYDVSLDGDRFIMIRSRGIGRDAPGVVLNSAGYERLVLVENWVEELKARVPR